MVIEKKNYIKFFIVFVFCLLVRLIPFRAPNIETIMATVMPIGRIYGAFLGTLFAIFSILFFDVITNTLGVHTFFTAFAYGVVGLVYVFYFKKYKSDKWGYVRFAIIGTLFFDAFTGLTVGPIFFNQSFINSLVGQIPFTALHLIGNIVLAYTLSPAIYHFMVNKKEKVLKVIISNFNNNLIL